MIAVDQIVSINNGPNRPSNYGDSPSIRTACRMDMTPAKQKQHNALRLKAARWIPWPPAYSNSPVEPLLAIGNQITVAPALHAGHLK
jgi:hypothetical protein